MHKDIALIVAVAFIGLGLIVVVVTNLGPPGAISQFKIPSPFLDICSTEECLEEQKLKGIPAEDRVVEMTYGEGWVKMIMQDGSFKLHSSIPNDTIQEYLDDPYYKQHFRRDRVSVELGEDWIKLTYLDQTEETFGDLTQKRMTSLIFKINN